MKIKGTKITREVRVVAYIIFWIDSLIKKGILPEYLGGGVVITDKRAFKKMLKNFEPTEIELISAMQAHVSELGLTKKQEQEMEEAFKFADFPQT